MPRVRASIFLLVAVLAGSTAATRAESAPRRVLLLYSYEREFSHYTFASLFRPELSRTSPDPIDFVEMTVQSIRSSRTEPDAVTVSALRETLGQKAPDLVVTIGGPAAVFAQKYRGTLFPATPILLAAVDNRFLESGPLPAGETAVAVKNEPLRMLESILRLLPDTKTVMVVIGSSKLEQFWVSEVQRLFRPYAGRLTFIFTNQMSLAQLVKQAGSLPPHAAILFGIYAMDADGVPQMELPTIDALHAAANAPMFGLQSHQLGHGIVGGSLVPLDEISRDTAATALRLLDGESPALMPPRTVLAAAPRFDARELHRWRIDDGRLPSGSTIAFREPSPWQRYDGIIAAAATFIGVQTIFAVGLTISLMRRRRRVPAPPTAWDVSSAEAALARLTHRLMQAHEDERARIATTLHDDVCQQMTGLKMRLQTFALERNPGDLERRQRLEELCDQFSGLERRILSLSDPVYARLEMLGLVGAARAFCHRLCQERGVRLEFEAADVPARLCGAVSLAVFRVLEEAMDNAVTHAAASRIGVTLAVKDGALELDVADDGIGFDPDATLRKGAIGLVGMRERLRLAGGVVTFASRPGGGSCIHAQVLL